LLNLVETCVEHFKDYVVSKDFRIIWHISEVLEPKHSDDSVYLVTIRVIAFIDLLPRFLNFVF